MDIFWARLVNFSVITLCLAPQRAIIAARVIAIRDFIISDLNKWHIFTNFGFNLWKKNATEKHQSLQKSFSVSYLWRTQNFYGFLSSNVSKIRLKSVNVQAVPPRFEKSRLWTVFAKTSTMTDNLPLHRPALKWRVALSCVTTMALSVQIFIGNLCWYRNRMIMCEMTSAHGCSF